jgi:hypothetical protein
MTEDNVIVIDLKEIYEKIIELKDKKWGVIIGWGVDDL